MTGITCPACGAGNDSPAESCFTCGRALFAVTEGSVLNERYQVLAPLGKGGMGMVYRARDLDLDEIVALKVLRADLVNDPIYTKRFRSEIKLARRVSHPNVCRIHELGKHGSLLFIVMECVEGVDLRHVLGEKGRLPPAEAFDLALQIAEALQAIHAEGIVHRDLKTPNVMVNTRNVAKLMDFGIARSLESTGATGATAAGQIVGTPEYMSPEQVRGAKVDTRSDIYALGIVIFELFTGRVPFRGDTPVATLFKHIQDPPPLEEAAELPRPLIPVLRKALAKAPEDRFQSAREFGEALRTARALASPETVPTWTSVPTHPAGALPPMSPPGTTVRVPTPTPAPVPTALPAAPPPAARAPAVSAAPSGTPPAARAATAVPTHKATPPAARAAPAWAGRAVPKATPLPPVPPRPRPETRPPRVYGLSSGTKRSSWLVVSAAVAVVVGIGVLLFLPSLRQPAPAHTADVASITLAAPAAVPSQPTTRSLTASATPATLQQPAPRETQPPAPPPTTAPRLTPKTTAEAPAVTGTAGASPASRVAQATPTPPLPTLLLHPIPESPAATPAGTTSANPPVMRSPEPARPGMLQILVAPWAEVDVDGVTIGTSPPLAPLSLAPGSHTVKLRHPDYAPFARKVTIRSGETTRLQVDLLKEAFPK